MYVCMCSKLRCNHTTNVPHFQQWGLNFETAVKYELLFNVYKIYSCNVYKNFTANTQLKHTFPQNILHLVNIRVQK